MSKDMDRIRRNVKLNHAHRLRLVVSDGGEQLGMECVECDELLEWVSDSTWWTCGCGVEVTPDEARVLMEQARGVLDEYVSSLGGERLGRTEGFWEWLTNRIWRRRPALPEN